MMGVKVIHVHFLFEKKKDYYFGSIAAIYNNLEDAEYRLGIKQSSLEHAGLVDGSVKVTLRALIRRDTLIRSTSEKK